MSKNLAQPLIAKKNASASADPWVWLFYIAIDSDYVAITNDNRIVTFAGIEYVPWGIQVGDFTDTSDGSLPELDITVSNISKDVNYLLNENKLKGKPIAIRKVNRAHLDDPTYCDTLFMVILSAAETNESVTFKLGVGDWFNQRLPRQNYSRTRCRNVFGTAEDRTEGCGWDGVTGASTCNHTLIDCRAHSNTDNFGAEPGIPRRFA